MSRIICVSNRVPHSGTDFTGGLTVAVFSGMAYGPHPGVWIGTGAGLAEDERSKVAGIDILRVAVPTEEYKPYYDGFHNQCLYPLFHELLGEYRFERAWMKAYMDVNERMARAVMAEIESPDDVIWVHDAQCLPIAWLLRTQDVSNPVGYFSHIPFPSRRVLRCFPAQHDLNDWLDHYDLVGFQTDEDAEGYRNGKAFPIGIDWEAVPVSSSRRDPTALKIVGIDRMDYSKGILQRFEGFSRYLRTLNFDANVHYTQISPPTRMSCPQYADYSGRVMQKAQELAQQHPGKLTFRPEAVSHPEALKLLGEADIALVTPLRDGMNLVAHEFVAAQNPDDPGGLVLSKTSGSAATFNGAYLVDPYDCDSIAEGIYQAATALSQDRKHYHKQNMEAVKAQNVFDWWNGFLADLVKPPV